MKRSGITAFLVSVVFTLSGSYAQSSASNPRTPTALPAPRIVTLNFNAAVLGTSEAQRSLGAFQKKYAPREQQLQKLNDDIEATKKTLADRNTKLSETEKNQKLQALGSEEKQLQRQVEDFKNDSETESQQAFQQIAQKVFVFVQQFSQRLGYDIVLDRGTEAAPIVWYAAGNVDITDQVMKSYDAKASATAPGFPDAPAATLPKPGTSPKQP